MVRSHDQVAATALINSPSLSALFPLKVRQRLRQQFRRAVGESGRPAPGPAPGHEMSGERNAGPETAGTARRQGWIFMKKNMPFDGLP